MAALRRWMIDVRGVPFCLLALTMFCADADEIQPVYLTLRAATIPRLHFGGIMLVATHVSYRWGLWMLFLIFRKEDSAERIFFSPSISPSKTNCW